MKGFRFVTAAVLAAAPALLRAADTTAHTLPTVLITAMRLPLPDLRVPGTFAVIDPDAMRGAGVRSLDEALRQFTDVSMQSRGPFGVQGDVSIRGSSYNQSLVLVNGIRVNDPQTAHHNLDIPLSMDQVERIEVLDGPASAQYGSDASGGVVNIITRSAGPRTSFRVAGGGFGLLDASGTFALGTTGVRSLNTLDRRSSAGYRNDTDFTLLSASSATTVDVVSAKIDIVGGYLDKEFGAFDFYSPGKNIPSREWTKTAFLSLASVLPAGKLLLHPRFYYRRHYDRFMYDIRTPDRFVNTHVTRTYGGEVNASTWMGSALCVAGISASADGVKSSNLGDHRRSSYGLYAAMNGVMEGRYAYEVGMREDMQAGYAPQWNPTVGIGYLFPSKGRMFATAGRSFRVPSYTELYYSDPANVGNPGLRPEIAWTYEVGAGYSFMASAAVDGSVFLREQSDLIDYVQYVPGDLYHAVNYTAATTRGADLSIHWSAGHDAPVGKIWSAYTFLDSRTDRGRVFASKNAFTHPRHRILWGVSGVLPVAGLQYSATAVRRIGEQAGTCTLLDARLSKTIAAITFGIQGSNLLNEGHEEIPGLPLPGRWLWGDVALEL